MLSHIVIAPAVMSMDAAPLRELERELEQRREAQRMLGKTIDGLLKQTASDEVQPTGCYAFLSALFGKRRQGSRAVPFSDSSAIAGAGVGAAAAAAAGAAAARRPGHSVFGLAAGKRIDATTKLEEAAAAMRMRVEQLEERVAEQRGEAKRLMQSGQKQAAMRALKKANAVQKQADSNQAAVDAVEQQMDALSQAAMQKTLASALASTSKTMKKDAKALGKAESAIDDAQEARDMASDLNQVMADFAANGNGHEDEDELMAELQAMMAEGDDPTPPPAAVKTRATGEPSSSFSSSSADAQASAMRQLEQKHAEWDAAEEVRTRMPEAPTHLNGKARAVERAGLLEGQAS